VRGERERAEKAVERAEVAEAEAAAAAALRGAYVGRGSSFGGSTHTSPAKGGGASASASPAVEGYGGVAATAAARVAEAKAARRVRFAEESRDRFEHELRRKMEAMERLRVQLEAKTASEQLMRTQLSDLASWLRALPPRMGAALTHLGSAVAPPDVVEDGAPAQVGDGAEGGGSSKGAGARRVVTPDGATRSAVVSALSQQVSAQMVLMEKQREERDALHAVAIAEAAKGAQGEVAAAEADMEAQRQLVSTLAALQSSNEEWDAKHTALLAEMRALRASAAEQEQEANGLHALMEARFHEEAAALRAETAASLARAEATELERAMLAEQAAAALERAAELSNVVEGKGSELAALRQEGSTQADVMGRMQQQLDGIRDDLQRERTAKVAVAAEAERLRAEVADEYRERSLAVRDSSQELAELRVRREGVQRASESNARLPVTPRRRSRRRRMACSRRVLTAGTAAAQHGRDGGVGASADGPALRALRSALCVARRAQRRAHAQWAARERRRRAA
jgi:chromosome segregation ATPase